MKISTKAAGATKRIPAVRLKKLRQNLLSWYTKRHRDLPWRRTRTPYRIWLSEVMLQQTQAATAIPYYERFLKRFPTVALLACSPLSRVLKTWEGLGYYARARNLHRAARHIVRHLRGALPRTYDELITIPGIGPYTAAAVASIAFNKPHAVVDGNVERVMSRLFHLAVSPKQKAGKKVVAELARQLLPLRQARWWNQAVMELGALVCTPRRPRCGDCPITTFCLAKRHLADPSILPVRLPRRSLPHYDIVLGLLWKDGRVFIDQRKTDGLLGGLWEFPGGKLRRGENRAAALRRELREELGIEAEVGKFFMSVEHSYSHFSVTLHAYHCRFLSGAIRPVACQAWRWARPKDLRRYAFPAANRKMIQTLLSEEGRS